MPGSLRKGRRLSFPISSPMASLSSAKLKNCRLRNAATREELYRSIDLPALRPLPAQPYVFAEWKRARADRKRVPSHWLTPCPDREKNEVPPLLLRCSSGGFVSHVSNHAVRDPPSAPRWAGDITSKRVDISPMTNAFAQLPNLRWIDRLIGRFMV